MDAISDMSFNDDSVADSDYVPNSVDETTTDYSTDDDISKVATLINIKHARPVVHLGSSEVVESVGSPMLGQVVGCKMLRSQNCLIMVTIAASELWSLGEVWCSWLTGDS